MTLAAQNTWTVEEADGSKTAFDINFKVYDTSAIEVRLIAADGTETLQQAGVDYAVTGSPGAYQVDFSGLAGPPANGLQVAIRPTLAGSQGEAFDDFSKFPASKTEAALDRAYHLIQTLRAVLDRAVRMPADENGLVLPAEAELIGKVPVRQADKSWLLIETTDLEALASRVSKIDALSTAGRLASIDAIGADLAGDDTIGQVAEQLSAVAAVAADLASNAAIATVGADLAGDDTIGAVAAQIASVVVVAANLAGVSDFSTKYLGAKAADPTLDNEGNALIDGALYWNTTLNSLKTYDVSESDWFSVPAPTFANVHEDYRITPSTTAVEFLNLSPGICVYEDAAGTPGLDETVVQAIADDALTLGITRLVISYVEYQGFWFYRPEFRQKDGTVGLAFGAASGVTTCTAASSFFVADDAGSILELWDEASKALYRAYVLKINSATSASVAILGAAVAQDISAASASVDEAAAVPGVTSLSANNVGTSPMTGMTSWSANDWELRRYPYDYETGRFGFWWYHVAAAGYNSLGGACAEFDPVAVLTERAATNGQTVVYGLGRSGDVFLLNDIQNLETASGEASTEQVAIASPSISAGDATLTAGSGAPFAVVSGLPQDPVGYEVTIPGAGAGGAALVAKIASRTSDTIVELDRAASTTVTSGASGTMTRVYQGSRLPGFTTISSTISSFHGYQGTAFTDPQGSTVKAWQLVSSFISGNVGQRLYEKGGTGSAILTALSTSVMAIRYLVSSGTFTVGEIVTGGTSGATATVDEVGVSGGLSFLIVSSISGGPFASGESISGGASGATGLVSNSNYVCEFEILRPFSAEPVLANTWEFKRSPNTVSWKSALNTAPPLYVPERITRAADQSQAIAAQLDAQHGASAAFGGFYSSHEPAVMAKPLQQFFKPLITVDVGGSGSLASRTGGANEVVWVAPAGPLDLPDHWQRVPIDNVIPSSPCRVLFKAVHPFRSGQRLRIEYAGGGFAALLNGASKSLYVGEYTPRGVTLYTDAALTAPLDASGVAALFAPQGFAWLHHEYLAGLIDDSGITHLAPQGSSGYGKDYDTGEQLFIDGFSELRWQLDEHFAGWRAVVNECSGVRLVANAELWQIEITQNDDYLGGDIVLPRPAFYERVEAEMRVTDPYVDEHELYALFNYCSSGIAGGTANYQIREYTNGNLLFRSRGLNLFSRLREGVYRK